MLKGMAAIQKDVDRLAEWDNSDFMKFSKRKCQVPHLKRKCPLL